MITKLAAFCMALNCFYQGWVWTGVLLLWIVFVKEFK